MGKEVSMTDTVRLHVIVEGRVQGVFFRAYTQEEAVRLGLVGWVKNMPNGSVEAIIEGEKAAVGKMLQWFHQGSPNSNVKKVNVTDESPIGNSSNFEIHYY
jgi:acylphosphatase